MTKYIVAAYAFADMLAHNLFPVAMGAYIEEYPYLWKISFSVCVLIVIVLFLVAEVVARRNK